LKVGKFPELYSLKPFQIIVCARSDETDKAIVRIDPFLPNIEEFQGGKHAIDAPPGLGRCVSSMEKRPRNPDNKEEIAKAAVAEDFHAPLEIDARKLLGPRQEATIIHGEERYRLRVTANNKLLLTK
jgi:hemin uptake protein HemP